MTTTKTKPALDLRVRRARAIGRAAKAKADDVFRDESRHRSTRTRAAYKIKAEALDNVMRALDGR